jgi:hypothetical protein
MSDEPKRPKREWLNWTFAGAATLSLACAYEIAHYRTFALVQQPGDCMESCTHQTNGNQVPEWVDRYFFWPANLIDHVAGIYPSRWEPPHVAPRR